MKNLNRFISEKLKITKNIKKLDDTHYTFEKIIKHIYSDAKDEGEICTNYDYPEEIYDNKKLSIRDALGYCYLVLNKDNSYKSFVFILPWDDMFDEQGYPEIQIISISKDKLNDKNFIIEYGIGDLYLNIKYEYSDSSYCKLFYKNNVEMFTDSDYEKLWKLIDYSYSYSDWDKKDWPTPDEIDNFIKKLQIKQF